MDVSAAAKLIADAVPRVSTTWCDLGAGSGTFTRALASLIDPEGRVYAVERDPRMVDALKRLAQKERLGASIIPVQGDFTQPLDLPPLDGALFANALHFVAPEEQLGVLSQVLEHIRPGGHLVVVDYDGRGPNRWVPYPISQVRLEELTRALGLDTMRVAGTRPSAYGGSMYAAFAHCHLPR